VTGRECGLDQLRYVKTMRAILKEFDISNEIGDFDDLLLQLADERYRRSFIDSRENLLERVKGRSVTKSVEDL